MANVQIHKALTALLNTHVQVRGVRGADQRDRGAQPGHERAPVPAQLGQSLDRIQLRHGNHNTSRFLDIIDTLYPRSTRRRVRRAGASPCPARARVCRTSAPRPS